MSEKPYFIPKLMFNVFNNKNIVYSTREMLDPLKHILFITITNSLN